MILLYHGTLRRYVRRILTQGLKPSVGWGGANTEGVFLSGSRKGAMRWAKMSWMREHGYEMEASRFSRHCKYPECCIAVLVVVIPASYTCHLRGDLEQLEDYLEILPEQYLEDQNLFEQDWQASLKYIGDVRYVKKIPPEWIHLSEVG